MIKFIEYLRDALDGFVKDPADTPYQAGYQAALEEMLRVAKEMEEEK